MDLEYTKQSRFSSGVNIKLGSTLCYKKYIENKLNLPKGIIKVRKEVIHQKNYKSKLCVVYAILS